MVLSEHANISENNILYEVIGTNPSCMFFSGIHGHEGNVFKHIKNVLDILSDGFPSRLELLRANPPALKLGVRGINGQDLNRDFKNENGGNRSWISNEIMELVSLYPSIDYVFSFHEETDPNGYRDKEGGGIEIFERDPYSFYIYDAFNSDDDTRIEIAPFFNSLATSLVEHGFSLYNGYDDYKNNPDETVQLNPVVNGYCAQPSNKTGFEDGTFENWVITQGMKRSFVFEIPSGISEDKRHEMINIIFEKFIIPFLNLTRSA